MSQATQSLSADNGRGDQGAPVRQLIKDLMLHQEVRDINRGSSIMKRKTEEQENRKRKTQRCYSMSSRRTRQQANAKRQAVYRGKRKQRESSGKHFGLPSGWLPELLRARTRACLTSLVSLGMRESRWGALRDRGWVGASICS